MTWGVLKKTHVNKSIYEGKYTAASKSSAAFQPQMIKTYKLTLQSSLPAYPLSGWFPTSNYISPIHVTRSHFLKIHLKIVLPSMSGSSKWSLSLRFHHQKPIYTSPPHMCYMPHPSHSSQYDHLNNILWGYRSLNSSFCRFLHSPVTSSLLGPKIQILHRITSSILWLQSALNFFLNRILIWCVVDRAS